MINYRDGLRSCIGFRQCALSGSCTHTQPNEHPQILDPATSEPCAVYLYRPIPARRLATDDLDLPSNPLPPQRTKHALSMYRLALLQTNLKSQPSCYTTLLRFLTPNICAAFPNLNTTLPCVPTVSTPAAQCNHRQRRRRRHRRNASVQRKAAGAGAAGACLHPRPAVVHPAAALPHQALHLRAQV